MLLKIATRPSVRRFSVLAGLFFIAGPLPAATSDWAKIVDGRLQYKTFGNGNRIMDFSYAGYRGGGVALPNVPTQRTVTPRGSGQDDTANIQAAINAVAALPTSGGFRGAVQLSPGTFTINGTLNLNASGVVLRGSGSSGSSMTTLRYTGSSRCPLNIAGTGDWAKSNEVAFTDTYVPSGTRTIRVTNATGFAVGNNVLITRTVTAAWVRFMGMDQLVRDGQPQTWLSPGTEIRTDRIITAISGNTITIDAPLTDSFDSAYLGTPVGRIAKYTFSGRISNVGLERMNIVAPTTVNMNAFIMDKVIDAWVRDVVCQEHVNAVRVGLRAKRVTLDNVIVKRAVTRPGGPTDFGVTGTQVLVNKCQALATGFWSFVTDAIGTGPIVVLNFYSTEASGIAPHMRWTTGVLADNCRLPNAPQRTPGIAYTNRSTLGSGHGWTTGWSVAWNMDTPWIYVQQPPGTTNWAIGCVSSVVSGSNGTIDSVGTKVTPNSLYLQQLLERLGPSALTNIGY